MVRVNENRMLIRMAKAATMVDRARHHEGRPIRLARAAFIRAFLGITVLSGDIGSKFAMKLRQ